MPLDSFELNSYSSSPFLPLRACIFFCGNLMIIAMLVMICGESGNFQCFSVRMELVYGTQFYYNGATFHTPRLPRGRVLIPATTSHDSCVLNVVIYYSSTVSFYASYVISIEHLLVLKINYRVLVLYRRTWI